MKKKLLFLAIFLMFLFNFRVSAKTKHNMDARQTASLVNNMGGGQVNYSVSQDTSGVSDNWLANKFAELA